MALEVEVEKVASVSLSLSFFSSKKKQKESSHIRLIPERKQLLTGMSTRVMLPVCLVFGLGFSFGERGEA